MEEWLLMAREIVTCLSGIDVRLVSMEDGSLNKAIRDTFYGALLPLLYDKDIETALKEIEPNCAYILTEILGLTYLLIRLPDSASFLMAGPCRVPTFSEGKLRSLLQQFHLSPSDAERILSYCRWQPQISVEKLYQLGTLLGHHVLGLREPLAFRQITYHWNAASQSVVAPPEQYVTPSAVRQIEMRYEASTVLTEAVKHGNLAMALRTLRIIASHTSSTMRNPNPLRNAQNYCIVMNTQLRHAMEEQKIHPYRLDQVSSEIATHIESIKSLDEVAEYHQQIVRRYCELALEKNYSHLDPLTRQIVVYIKSHLTDNLTVKDTAKALLLNANYLSGKFHQSMGMTFTDFVNQQRTEQAASLLKHTDLQIQQISSAVGYNNASHFAKQFLRFYGETPRNYRSRNKL